MAEIRICCPSCTSERIKVHNLFYKDEVKDIVYLATCKDCGLGFFDKRIDENRLNQLYDDKYFNSDWGPYSEPYEQAWVRRMNDFVSLEMTWIKYLKSSGKALDIGCAGGAVVKAFQENGFDAIGVELNAKLCQFGKNNLKVEIYKEDVTKNDFLINHGKFDLIYIGDVLEHLNEPKQFLGKLHSILEKNGIIVIEVPMFEINRFSSRVRLIYSKLLAKKMSFTNIPYHVIFFNPRSIKHLVCNSGFKIVDFRSWKENSILRGKYDKSPIKIKILEFIDHFLPKLIKQTFDDRAFIVIKEYLDNKM